MNLRSIWKRVYGVITAAALLVLLPGCMLVFSPDELFSLPKLPEEYLSLGEEIEALLDDGYEYAAPTGGENIQLVQMIDLDGDGIDEALVFLRKANDEKPQKICVFKNGDDGYKSAAMISESASSVSRVDYEDLNGDGKTEIVVGWQMMNVQDAAQDAKPAEHALTRVVSVYNMERFSGQKIMETSYNQYAVEYLDSDTLPELIVITSGVAGNCEANVYQWNMGAMEKRYTERLSMTPTTLRSVQFGGLIGGGKGLFVTGTITDDVLITDILVLNEDGFRNCTMNQNSGVSRLVYGSMPVEQRDVNHDGVMEIPIPYEMKKQNPDDQTYVAVNWTAFSDTGKEEVVESAYYNMTDGWYLVLPESWKHEISITGVSNTPGERAVTFGIYVPNQEEPMNILTIYTETGDSREYKANKGNRFVLSRQSTTVYAAEFLKDSQYWEGTMTQDALKQGFRMIRTDWYLN